MIGLPTVQQLQKGLAMLLSDGGSLSTAPVSLPAPGRLEPDGDGVFADCGLLLGAEREA